MRQVIINEMKQNECIKAASLHSDVTTTLLLWTKNWSTQLIIKMCSLTLQSLTNSTAKITLALTHSCSWKPRDQIKSWTTKAWHFGHCRKAYGLKWTPSKSTFFAPVSGAVISSSWYVHDICRNPCEAGLVTVVPVWLSAEGGYAQEAEGNLWVRTAYKEEDGVVREELTGCCLHKQKEDTVQHLINNFSQTGLSNSPWRGRLVIFI